MHRSRLLQLQQLHIVSTKELVDLSDGTFIKVAGLVLVRQRPDTAGGVCFITIEDEASVANLVDQYSTLTALLISR